MDTFTKRNVLVLAATITMLAACQSAQAQQQTQSTGAAPSAQPPNLQASGNLCDNPFISPVEGATWTSSIHTDQGDSTQVDTITDVGSDAFLVQTTVGDISYVITWKCTSDGLLWIQTDGGMFSAVFQGQGETQTWSTNSFSGVSIPKQIQPGDTWSSSENLSVTDSTGTTIYDLSIDFEAVGEESVTVPAGTFSAMRLDFVINWSSQYGDVSLPYSEWFAPNVGLVKSSAQGSELELVSYSIP